MFERSYLQQIKTRINEDRKFIQVILGPRQVGKTTLVHQLLSQIDTPSIFESADGVFGNNSVWIDQIWETARLKLSHSSSNEILLVIDEIQKIDRWSEFVKSNWDRDTNANLNLKVILLGSSRLLIQKGLTESLAGRFETTHFNHWSFEEMESAFGWTLNQYIYFGGYPGSASLISDEIRWKNYVQDSLIETSISKDILMMTRIDKPALLRKLFELGTAYSGQILSLNKIVGELQDAGNSTTLSHYLSLLSESKLLHGIEKYAGELIRKRASSPKFQVYNNALLSAQNTDSFQNVSTDAKQWGRLVESAIGAHLLNHATANKYKVYYWRERSDEVDFVLEWGNRTVAIEVKSGRRGENRGMKVFSEKFNCKKIYLVGTGGIPLSDFLKMNPISLF